MSHRDTARAYLIGFFLGLTPFVAVILGATATIAYRIAVAPCPEPEAPPRLTTGITCESGPGKPSVCHPSICIPGGGCYRVEDAW